MSWRSISLERSDPPQMNLLLIFSTHMLLLYTFQIPPVWYKSKHDNSISNLIHSLLIFVVMFSQKVSTMNFYKGHLSISIFLFSVFPVPYGFPKHFLFGILVMAVIILPHIWAL